MAAHLMIRFGKIKMVANRPGLPPNCEKYRKLGNQIPPQPFFFSQTLEYDETSRQLRCQARIATFCNGGPNFSLERLIGRGARKTSHWEQMLTDCNWVAGNARLWTDLHQSQSLAEGASGIQSPCPCIPPYSQFAGTIHSLSPTLVL